MDLMFELIVQRDTVISNVTTNFCSYLLESVNYPNDRKKPPINRPIRRVSSSRAFAFLEPFVHNWSKFRNAARQRNEHYVQ